MEGRDETLALHQPSRGKGHYFFAIQHVWANKPVTENYVIDFKDKSLDIQIDAPSVILPGDEKEISITVKDPRGRPVEDVDLLSYGLTSKFKNYSPPDLPDHHKFRKSRKLINEFNPRVVEQKERDQRMDFKRWKRTLGLDSLEYYKFLYPTGGLYTARTPAPGGETQFSLFVMKEGKPVPVSVIQADRRPVYFSWALNNRYAFAIDSGRHTIRIRTAEREFELTDIYFEKGMKTVISIPWDYTGKGVNAEDKKKYLSEYEKRLYYSYVIKLQSVENQLAYLKSGNGVFQWEGLGRHTIGPLYRKSFDFYSPGRFTLNNIEREPFYTYEIKPEMARLTSFDMPRGKQRLIQYGELKDHRDFVLRESDILDELDNRKLQMLMGFSMFDYPRTTDAGYASLEISLDTTVYQAKGAPFFKIIRNIDDDGDFEVYPGREKVFHNLEEGRYQMITLFFDSTYFISDTLSVKTRGTNYRKLTPVNYLGRDDFWRETMNYLMEMATKSYGRDPYRMERVAPREIQKIYYKEHVYTEGNTAWGTVMDEDGTPLPGVSIVIKGTAIGTVTDMEGYYELNVPNGSYTLTYSFIGFATIEKEGYGSKRADVGMQADVTQLSEVVVVAYGVQRESKAMGFSVSNVSEALMGMAPGVSITNVQNAGDIRIRGNSTLGDNSSPLYIIDGVPYTGDPGTLSPDMIANIEVLKDKSLTAIYGSRAEGGVVLITTKGSHTVSIPTLLGNRENEADLYPMSMDAASLRNNFSDAAFWKPDLITDKNGEVSFKATFPDDITRWDLHVLGVKKKQTGMAKTTVRSFKPLSAQLALPRFLVEGDSAMIIGKTMNYTSDSLAVTTHFSLNDKDTARHEFTVVNAIIDSLMLTGMKGNDTLKVRYMLNRPDGYFDGEEREIPIIPAGTVKRVGDIMLLDRDTTLSLPTLPGKGPVVITASATFMEALVKQAERLVQYQYECNEQLASKLLGYLTLEKLEPGKSRAKEIKEHINKLQNNQNREELWGWWNKSGNTSFWISEHVLYALGEARKSGYGVQLKTSRAIDQLLLDFGRTDARRKIDMLELLKQMDQRLNISGYLKAVPSMDSLSPHDQFRLL
ncbi:MAG: carboxypeptidase-like regulatory domain-containing protein, partial [Cyclobacteriaceae bacterium]|nr:carboxypeptidase-like regulatory domain-containing protein [Cyclobacteriaceae bacterium]